MMNKTETRIYYKIRRNQKMGLNTVVVQMRPKADAFTSQISILGQKY